MRQAATGKWYAYIADMSAFDTALITVARTQALLMYRFPIRSSYSSPRVRLGLLAPSRKFEFEDGDEVEITAGRDESVTLTYDDHSDIATISVDRNDAPAGGQVHITISDFQLNLDPTADDTWTLNVNNRSNLRMC